MLPKKLPRKPPIKPKINSRSHLPKLPFSHTAVPRIQEKIDSRLISRLFENDKPVIISDALNSWKPYQDTSTLASDTEKIEYFDRSIGSRSIVFASTSANGAIPYTRYKRQIFRATFSNFAKLAVETHGKGTVHYAESLPINQIPGFQSVKFKDFGRRKSSRVWIGFGGEVTNLHFDGYHNMMGMISGIKRVTLFPYEAMPFLYPAPIDRGIAVAPTSCVRLLKPDFKKFPLLKKALAQAQVAILKPGDTLYIPPLWWHHVESFDFSVMANTWFSPLAPKLSAQIVNGLNEAVDLFSEVPQDLRNLFAHCYNELLFESKLELGFHEKDQSKTLSDPDHISRILNNLVHQLALYRKLPHPYRDRLATNFEYFVFHLYGRPLSHLPEPEFLKMVDRLARLPKRKTGSGRLWGL